MKKKTCESGIGLVAVIAIVAILGIGSVAAVQVYNNNKAEVTVDETETKNEVEQKIGAAKDDAGNAMLRLQADLKNSVNANLNTALSTIAEVRADLNSAYAGASAEMQMELSQFNQSLNKLEAEVKAKSSSAAETAESIAVDLKEKISNDMDVKTKGEASVNNNAGTANGSMDSKIDAGGSVNASGDSQMNDGTTTIELNTEMQGGVNGAGSL
jgi:hypothetical protein